MTTSPDHLAPCVAALQWLLDDMHDAGETHDDDGLIFDSVESAAAALIEGGGSLPWFTVDDAQAYWNRAFT